MDRLQATTRQLDQMSVVAHGCVLSRGSANPAESSVIRFANLQSAHATQGISRVAVELPPRCKADKTSQLPSHPFQSKKKDEM